VESTSLGDDGKTPKRGGTLRYALAAESPEGFCLPEAQLAAGIPVAMAIYDRLLVPDADGEPVPYLAKSVTPSDDYTQWTLELRPGITFHDGTKLDAQIVKDNLDAYRGAYPTRKPLLFTFYFEPIEAVTVVDPMTVRVDTKVPWVAFPSYLASGRVGIMARAQLDDERSCDRNLIGTGPFVLESWRLNDQMVLKANRKYWREAPDGKPYPYLDGMVMAVMPDSQSRINALKTGEIDILTTASGDSLEEMRGLAEQGKATINPVPSPNSVSYLLFNAGRPPFDDVLARRAFATAFDVDAYNEVVNDGQFTLADGPFAEGTLGHLAETPQAEYDLAEAKQLVAKYEKKTGRSFDVALSVTTDPVAVSQAQLIQEQMRKAGIGVRITTADGATTINNAIAGKFQVALWANTHAGGDPDEQHVWWYSTSPVNFGRIKDPVIDKALDEGRSEPDPAKRKEIYERLNREFGKQQWNLWTTFLTTGLATAPDVHGLLPPSLPDGSKPYNLAVDSNPLYAVWKE